MSKQIHLYYNYSYIMISSFLSTSIHIYIYIHIYTCTLMWMPNYCLYWKNWFWILAHVSRGAAAISVFAQVVGL